MIEEFDDATTTPSMMPIKFKPRFRYIIPPPPLLYRTEAILKLLASRVGEVDKVDVKVTSFGNGDFQRARVKLIADKPLPRVVTFSPEGTKSMRLLVKYKNISKFCKFCGLMGNDHAECGSGEQFDGELHGKWMLAPDLSWHPSTPRMQWGFAPV
jgi:hypothetical protein